MSRRAFATFWFLLIAGPVQAQTAVMECRPLIGVGTEVVTRDIWVIIDRTAVLPAPVQASAITKLRKALQPGDRIQLLGFSSLQGEEFTQRRLDATLSSALTDQERYELPKRTVSQLEKCLVEQERRVHAALQQQMAALLSAPLTQAANSDVLLALSDVSQQLVALSTAERRMVLIISDMIEHSAITSFYARKTLRRIDPAAELAKVQEAGLTARFEGADLFVMGAGALPGDTGGYRGLPELLALRTFWEQFFEQSGGQLKGWGQPELLMELPR